MAKVETLSRNNSSCCIANDASFVDFSLEFSEESPKNDFDFSNLLSDNEIKFEKQCPGKDYSYCKASNFLSKDSLVTFNSSLAANSSMSLSALAQNHFENGGKLSDWNFDDFNHTGTLCFDNFCASSSGKDIFFEQNYQPYGETLDGELVPDIDLSFCIKNDVEDKLSVGTFSPESVDSGFDETGFASDKSTESLSNQNVINNSKYDKGKLASTSRQSLLSRAMSAKPVIDVARLAKLQKIRCELFKKPSSSIDCYQGVLSERLIDRTNENIITSSFQAFDKH